LRLNYGWLADTGPSGRKKSADSTDISEKENLLNGK
jgi:hypothetical protein